MNDFYISDIYYILKDLGDADLFEDIINRSLLRLKDTNYYVYVTYDACYWYKIDGEDSMPEPINFCEVFEGAPKKIQNKFIFHLDILRESRFTMKLPRVYHEEIIRRKSQLV
jgi:hypothetical protein